MDINNYSYTNSNTYSKVLASYETENSIFELSFNENYFQEKFFTICDHLNDFFEDFEVCCSEDMGSVYRRAAKIYNSLVPEEKQIPVFNLDFCKTEELVLHAVLLLRKINRQQTKEEQIREMLKIPREDLVDYIRNFDAYTTSDSNFIYDEVPLYAEEYTPCCTNRDYGPSNPWDAPGMSIRDFI